jgi:tape measure domain-containing protein
MDIATLSIKVKSDGVTEAGTKLERLTTSANKAEQAIERLTTRFATFNSSIGGSSSATAAFMNSLQSQTTAVNSSQAALAAYTRQINQMVAAINSANSTHLTQNLNTQTTSMDRASSSGGILNNTLKSMAVAALAYVGVNFAKGIIEQADAWVMMQAKLNLAVGSMEGAKFVQGELVVLANKLRVPLADAAQLYTRMATPMTALGKSAKETMGMVEGVSMALKLSGATGQEASSVMLQFSQSMNAGRLNGGEFNAVAEGAPIILRAIEAELRRVGMGTELATKGLKKMAADGKISAEILSGALNNGAFVERMKTDFATLPLTVDGALTKIKNTWEQSIGKMGEDTQFTKGIIDGLADLEKSLPKVVSLLGSLFSTIVDYGATALKTILAIGIAFAAWKIGAVLMTATSAVSTLNVALAALAANPVGLALIALAAAATGVAYALNKVSEEKEKATKASNDLIAQSKLSKEAYEAETIQIKKQIDALREKAGFESKYSDQEKGVKQVKELSGESKADLNVIAAQKELMEKQLAFDKSPFIRLSDNKKALDLARQAYDVSVSEQKLAVARTLERQKQIKDAEHSAALNKAQELHGQVEDKVKSKDDKAIEAFMAQRKLLEEQKVYENELKNPSISKDDRLKAEKGLADQKKDILAIDKKIAELQTKGKDVAVESLSNLNAEIAKLKEKYEIERRGLVNKEILSSYSEQKGNTTAQQGGAEREKIIQDRIAIETSALDAERAVISKYRYADVNKQAEQQSKLAVIEMQFGKLKSDEQMRQAKLSIDMVAATTDATVKEYEKQGEFLKAFEAKRQAGHIATQLSSTVPEDAKATEASLYVLDETAAKSLTASTAFDKLAASTQNALRGIKTASEGLGIAGMMDAATGSSQTLADNMGMLKEKLSQTTDPKKYEELNTQLIRMGEEQRQMWEGVGKSITDSLTSAFGEAGKSLGTLMMVTDSMFRKQKELAAQKEAEESKINKMKPEDKAAATAALNIEYSKKEAQARMKSYGDMAGAAKGFFKENSNGYNLLKNVEGAFRAFEVAEALSSFAIKSGLLTTFSGLFMTTQAAEAATAVATESVKQGAYSTSALAAALTIPPPFGWIAMGITAAALASIGISASKGSAPSGMNMEDPANKQKMQGTGTVLGDSNAKSEFISKSIDILAKNSNLGLVHSSSMMNSMKAVAANIGAFVGDIARTSGVLGASTSGINEKVVSTIGKIFGGSSTTIDDKGLSVSGGSLSSIKQNGMDVKGYTQVSEDSFWKGSKDYRVLQALPDASKGISKIIVSLSQAITDGANALGLGGDDFQKRLDSFVVSINDISAKGLTGTEFEKQVQAEISKIGDQMAEFALPQLKEFGITVGSGMGEAIATLVNNLQQVKDVFSVLNKPMNLIGLDAVRMSEQLVKAAGGTEALTTSVKFYVDNFIKGNDLIQPSITNALELQKEIGRDYAMTYAQLQLLSGSSVITKEQLVDLVKSVDLTTKAGAELFNKLMIIAPAINTVSGAIADAQSKYKEASDNANSAISNAASAYQNFVDNVTSTSDRLKKAGQDITSKFESSGKDLTTATSNVTSAQNKITDGYVAAGNKVANIQKQITQGLQGMTTNLVKFLDSMMTSDLGGLSKQEQMKNLKANFNKNAEAAKKGDFSAGNELTSIATNMLKILADTSSSSVEFAIGAAEIKNSVSDVIKAQGKTAGEPLSQSDQLRQDLIAAQVEQAQWADVVMKSGADFAKKTESLLADYDKAIAAEKDAVFAHSYWATVVKEIGLTIDKTNNGLTDNQAAIASSGKDLVDAYYKAQADSKNAVEDLKAANIIRNGLELKQATSLENFVLNIKDVNEKAKLASEAAANMFDLAAKGLLAGDAASLLIMKDAKDGMSKWQLVIETTAKGIADSVIALQNNATATIANIKQSLEDAKKTQSAGVAGGLAGVAANDASRAEQQAKVLQGIKDSVTQAYSYVGRSGMGEAAGQIDTKGFNYWVSQLSTGKVGMQDFWKVFNEAGATYSEADASKYQDAINKAAGNINAPAPTPPTQPSVAIKQSDSAALLAEVKQMKEQIVELKNDTRIGDLANVQATKSVHKLLNDVTDQGTALYTTPVV